MNHSVHHPTVSIIGAGPYGLAIATHLKMFNVTLRIFGSPMHRWLCQMPSNMYLKSEGCASSLYDPAGRYTLDEFCRKTGDPYSEYGFPISRDLLARYALSFQQALVPDVENILVSAIKKLPSGFELRLSTGEKLETSQVIIATGLDHMEYVPDELANLPAELRSHSADHFDLSGFKGKEVTVIGAGQSGLETAAILREEGASVKLVVRKPSLLWNPMPLKTRRSLYRRLRSPRTRLGDSRNYWIYDNVPGLFHYYPQQTRLIKAVSELGPAGAWWLKERVVGHFPIFLGCRIHSANVRGERVSVHIKDQDGRPKDLMADHVIAATGYKFNIDNLPFLSSDMKAMLLREQQSPRLSSNFESSMPGLYFTGFGSANSFGPVMRFLAGSSYTARRISRHLARGQRLRTPPLGRPKKCVE